MMTSNICVFSCLHKCYEQSGAGVDFVCTYEKIRATKILMNAKIPVNFLLRTVYTQIRSAHVS